MNKKATKILSYFKGTKKEAIDPIKKGVVVLAKKLKETETNANKAQKDIQEANKRTMSAIKDIQTTKSGITETLSKVKKIMLDIYNKQVFDIAIINEKVDTTTKDFKDFIDKEIKRLEEDIHWNRNIIGRGGSGPSFVSSLNDVSVVGATKGQVLTWFPSIGKWIAAGNLSKTPTYNSNGTLATTTDTAGVKTFSYTNGFCTSIAGTGIYPNKTLSFNAQGQWLGTIVT